MLANSANLALSQTVNANPASVSCDLTFTLTVVNSGIVDATGVFVTNRLPNGVDFVSATTSQGSFAQNGQSVVFNLGTLPVRSNATMTVTVLAAARKKIYVSNDAAWITQHGVADRNVLRERRIAELAVFLRPNAR